MSRFFMVQCVESLAIVHHCLREYTFSCFDKTPACFEQTARHTAIPRVARRNGLVTLTVMSSVSYPFHAPSLKSL